MIYQAVLVAFNVVYALTSAKLKDNSPHRWITALF